MRLVLAAWLVLAAGPDGWAAARREAYGPPPPPTPFDLCDAAIREVGRDARVAAMPDTLLMAIARVESGRLDPVAGRVRPWPWTINVEGVGSYFETKAEAVAAVQAFQEKGVRSIDVGCMQVNLFHHPAAFATLDVAFDPAANAAYAARFLGLLHGQTRDWNLATAMYHSQSQERGEDYQRRVFGRVMTPMGPSLGSAAGDGAAKGVVFGAIPPSSSAFGAIPPASLAFGAIPPASAAFGAFAASPSAPGVAAVGPLKRPDSKPSAHSRQ